MSVPSVDLEKGITGLKEEKDLETGITGLKEEKVVHQFKHPIEAMCMKLFMDVYPVLFFVTAMFGALYIYWQNHTWWQGLVLSACAIMNFWIFQKMKHAYKVQHNTLASADGDLSTTLLASSKK